MGAIISDRFILVHFFPGVWRPTSDCVSVTAIDVFLKHPTKLIVAVAYQNGDIRIFNYPCQTYGVNFDFSSDYLSLIRIVVIFIIGPVHRPPRGIFSVPQTAIFFRRGTFDCA